MALDVKEACGSACSLPYAKCGWGTHIRPTLLKILAQAHLCSQLLHHAPLTTLHLGVYLLSNMQMGLAAQKAGITIQYCMPYPRHALQSVELPAVTQIRVSDDYVPGPDWTHQDSAPEQWRIGGSSILADALSLSAFKCVLTPQPIVDANASF